MFSVDSAVTNKIFQMKTKPFAVILNKSLALVILIPLLPEISRTMQAPAMEDLDAAFMASR